MNLDWAFVAFLVVCALLSGYTLGVWRGKTLGYRHGRRSAWEEYTRQVGHAPPPLPPALPTVADWASQTSVDDIDFGEPRPTPIRHKPDLHD